MFGNRKVLFDNKTQDEGKKAEQVNKLLSLVDEIKRNNNGQSITDGMYKEIKVKIYVTYLNGFPSRIFLH